MLRQNKKVNVKNLRKIIFAEFDKRVLESLRQPLEDREITISRAKGSVKYPAHFILIATMNPCPCGNYGVKGKECICSAQNIERYRRKLSGPIVDRIDIWVEVSKVEHERLTDSRDLHEKTEKIKPRVGKARKMQEKRYKGLKIKTSYCAVKFSTFSSFSFIR